MNVQEYRVTGMTCGHCERSVSEEVRKLPGVLGVEASAATGALTVNADVEVADEAVLGAVAEAGYTASRV